MSRISYLKVSNEFAEKVLKLKVYNFNNQVVCRLQVWYVYAHTPVSFPSSIICKSKDVISKDKRHIDWHTSFPTVVCAAAGDFASSSNGGAWQLLVVTMSLTWMTLWLLVGTALLMTWMTLTWMTWTTLWLLVGIIDGLDDMFVGWCLRMASAGKIQHQTENQYILGYAAQMHNHGITKEAEADVPVKAHTMAVLSNPTISNVIVYKKC